MKNNTLETCNYISVGLLYLVSYEHMGSATVWIDGHRTIENVEGDDRDVVDALHSVKTSESTAHLVTYPCGGGQDLFLHVQVIESIPKRTENKFKITGIVMLGY